MSAEFIDYYPTENNEGMCLEFADNRYILFYSMMGQNSEAKQDSINHLRFKFVKDLEKSGTPIRQEIDGFLQFGEGQLEAQVAGATEKSQHYPEDLLRLVNQDLKWNYEAKQYENLKEVDPFWRFLGHEDIGDEVDHFMQDFIAIPEETIKEIVMACHKANLKQHVAFLHEDVYERRDYILNEKNMLLQHTRAKQALEKKLLEYIKD